MSFSCVFERCFLIILGELASSSDESLYSARALQGFGRALFLLLMVNLDFGTITEVCQDSSGSTKRVKRNHKSTRSDERYG